MDNSKRIGYFTSSQISRLASSLKNGSPSTAFKGYIEEVFSECAMKRTASVDIKTIPIKWGSLMEIELFNKIGLGYRMSHKETLVHPKHSSFWSGTPDLISKSKIGEVKCFYPKNFALLSICILQKDIELFRSEFPKEYWQCVSNAIICEVDTVEIISFMPSKSELEEVIRKIEETNFLEGNGLEPSDYYFMTNYDIDSLPYLPEDSPMDSINTFEFEVPKEDIDFLEERVLMANELLQSRINELKLNYENIKSRNESNNYNW